MHQEYMHQVRREIGDGVDVLGRVLQTGFQRQAHGSFQKV